MQFTFFHLMPYRPLDMAERHKHPTSWVMLPNRLYDPKKGADEYQSYIDQLVYAEKLGFDVIAVNEHHQTAYGIMPAPNLIAATLIDQFGLFGAVPLWIARRAVQRLVAMSAE